MLEQTKTNFSLTISSSRVQVPDIFQKLSKDICEADANAVDLGRMNKNFYEFGRYLTRFDNIGHVGPMLVEVTNFFWNRRDGSQP